jgi:hypothetical protein
MIIESLSYTELKDALTSSGLLNSASLNFQLGLNTQQYVQNLPYYRRFDRLSL